MIKLMDILNEGINVKKWIKAVEKGKDVVVYDKKGKRYNLQGGDNKSVQVTDHWEDAGRRNVHPEKTWQTLPLSKIKKIVAEGKLNEEAKGYKQALQKFIKYGNKQIKAYFKKHYDKTHDRGQYSQIAFLKPGKKYDRIVNVRADEPKKSNGGVHCFIEKETGIIYKPKSWSAPATNFGRASIFKPATYKKIDPHGSWLSKIYKEVKLTEVRTSKAGFEILDKMTYGQGSRFGRMTNANYLNHTPKGIVFGGSKWKNKIKKVEIIKTGKNKYTIEFAKGIRPGQKVVKKNIEGEMIHSTLKQALGI